MPYIVENPAIQGLKEGNRIGLQNQQMFENLARAYDDHMARTALQLQQQDAASLREFNMLRNNINPITGQNMPYSPIQAKVENFMGPSLGLSALRLTGLSTPGYIPSPQFRMADPGGLSYFLSTGSLSPTAPQQLWDAVGRRQSEQDILRNLIESGRGLFQ